MVEDGWTQGVCQEEPGFARLLINSLERLGITERARYYNREYEQLGTLRCRVVLSVARSNRHTNISTQGFDTETPTYRAYTPGTARKEADKLVVEFPCTPTRTRAM
jgi:hypothetical protein